ncbi:DUF5130 family protein [Nocardioides sp. MH1]|uniref:DUF5130 family protein n=1 Tax=Nocardioides sp. MH1 TaxID=3242490 RepID=UPI00351FB205
MPDQAAADQSYGRYQVTGLLGRGGMGVVHRAEDTVLGRPVALKLLSSALSDDAEFRERFGREAALLAKLDSPNVVHIYDFGEVDGVLFMATQLIEGGDLSEMLRDSGPLDLRQALDVVLQLCEGLGSAHETGVVHRDVKPSNVLVRRRGGRLQAFLCDFGIAATTESEMTRAGGVVGSPAYMAPERHYGARPDISGDIYSMGCVLWALVTGHPPYAGTPLQIARRHVEDPIPRLAGDSSVITDLNRLLGRALAKSAADRHATVDELAADVRALLPYADGSAPLAAASSDDDIVDATVVSEWAGEVTMFGAHTTIVPPTATAELSAQRPAEPVRFTARDHRRIERAIDEVLTSTGTTISVYIGRTAPPPRPYALGLHATLDRAAHAVLLMMDPHARVFEIVTGGDIRGRLPDHYVARVADDMKRAFGAGELTRGLVDGIRALGAGLDR